MERAKGFEPSTFSLGSCATPDVSIADTPLTTGDAAACTSACTSEAENAHETPADAQGHGQGEGIAQGAATPLESLAQAIANLSADDRAKLAAMLTGGNGPKDGQR